MEDWCRLRNHTTVASLYTIQKFGWGTGDESLLYDKGRSPIYCFDPSTGDSIAALHIFSSGDSQTVRMPPSSSTSTIIFHPQLLYAGGSYNKGLEVVQTEVWPLG